MKPLVSTYDSTESEKFRLRMPHFSAASGSILFTTVENLARWDRNYFEGRVGANVVEEMQIRSKFSYGCRIGYASGLVTGHKGVTTF